MISPTPNSMMTVSTFYVQKKTGYCLVKRIRIIIGLNTLNEPRWTNLCLADQNIEDEINFTIKVRPKLLRRPIYQLKIE